MSGLSVTQPLVVTVAPTLTSIAVSPVAQVLSPNGTQQFSATGYDQFGNVLASQPTFTYSLSNGSVGAITGAGMGALSGSPAACWGWC